MTPTIFGFIIIGLLFIIAVAFCGTEIKRAKKEIDHDKNEIEILSQIITSQAETVTNNTDDINSLKEDYVKRTMSFDECNEVIEMLITDIYTNKYLVYYRLKDMRTLPNMDEEIAEISKEIYESLGNGTKKQISYYYSNEYLIKLITRKVQVLLIDYINTYKPSSK